MVLLRDNPKRFEGIGFDPAADLEVREAVCHLPQVLPQRLDGRRRDGDAARDARHDAAGGVGVGEAAVLAAVAGELHEIEHRAAGRHSSRRALSFVVRCDPAELCDASTWKRDIQAKHRLASTVPNASTDRPHR
jgi:hypothetical protein